MWLSSKSTHSRGARPCKKCVNMASDVLRATDVALDAYSIYCFSDLSTNFQTYSSNEVGNFCVGFGFDTI